MANRNGRCVICGDSPTVKAHLFPRALMFDMRADSNYVVAGNINRQGITYQQNGEWDDRMLCKLHEDVIGLGDKYAVEFCRSFASQARPAINGNAIAIHNPTPDLLIHFVYGTVWRHAHAKSKAKELGPYEGIIRAALLNGSYDLQVLIGISTITVRGEKSLIALGPYRQKLGPYNTWHFVLGGLDFHLLTDKRRFPSDWTPYLANDNNPLILTAIESMDIHTIPMLQPLLSNMLKARVSREK